jgi:MerR family transcriptional regulator, light-induced transcriptional regulator
LSIKILTKHNNIKRMKNPNTSPLNTALTPDKMGALTHPIASAELETGLSKDTLRIWERRYGFPTPERDRSGNRVYTATQVEQLKSIKRLTDAGHRPGKIVGLALNDLLALEREYLEQSIIQQSDGTSLLRMHTDGRLVDIALAPSASISSELYPVLSQAYLLLRDNNTVAFQALLQEQLKELGLNRFVREFAAPFTAQVGMGWQRTELEIYQEHWYTDCISAFLQRANVLMKLVESKVPFPADTTQSPTILLTTVPGEPHSLGLLMAKTLFEQKNCTCISIGLETPLQEIVKAAKDYSADVIALSYSIYGNRRQCINSLRALRKLLPPHVSLWVGGQNPALVNLSQASQSRTAGISILRQLNDIDYQVNAWRQQRNLANLSAHRLDTLNVPSLGSKRSTPT